MLPVCSRPDGVQCGKKRHDSVFPCSVVYPRRFLAGSPLLKMPFTGFLGNRSRLLHGAHRALSVFFLCISGRCKACLSAEDNEAPVRNGRDHPVAPAVSRLAVASAPWSRHFQALGTRRPAASQAGDMCAFGRDLNPAMAGTGTGVDAVAERHGPLAAVSAFADQAAQLRQGNFQA